MPRDRSLGRARQHLFGRADGCLGRGATHLGERLLLGLGDLGLRHLGAARDKVLELGMRLGGEPLGIGLGAFDNRGGLFLGIRGLRLYSASRACASLLQLGGLVEFRLDARMALVERPATVLCTPR